MSSVPSGGGVPKGRRGSVLPCLGKATPIKLCSPRALIGSVARKKSKRPTGSGALISANFTCSFCNSSRRMRSWRLSPACPTAPWSFRSPRKTVCRLLWIWCFPCSLLLGGRPVFRLLPVEGSMPQLARFYTRRSTSPDMEVLITPFLRVSPLICPTENTFGGDPDRSPLKGNPPFRGTPSALGHEGVRGRRLRGAAMLCRLQCARFAKRMAHC